MTTYRLPDWLGGREAIHVLTANGMPVPDMDGMVHVLVATDDGDASIIVRAEDLIEVVPPLPPVPDAPAVMVRDHVFAADVELATGKPVFHCPGSCHKHMYWDELNGYAAEQGGPIVALVPDPAADAPALPWFSDEVGREDSDQIDVTPGNNVWIRIEHDSYGPDDAELRARIILAAARQARAARDHEEASRA